MAEREELLQSQMARLEVTEKERTSQKVCLQKTKQDKLCLEKTKQDARDQDIDGKLAEKQKEDLHSSTLSRSDDVCNAASFGNKRLGARKTGLSPPPQYFYTDRSKAVLLLWFLTVLVVCIYTLVQLLC